MADLALFALKNFPLVAPGDDLAALITDSLTSNQLTLEDGDILVLAQKIVSKAENRYRELASVTPSAEAKRYSGETGKDPRLVELVLQESKRVLRHRTGVMVVEHQLGFVHANAGIDQSNLPDNADSERCLLLPENPDASAEQLRAALSGVSGKRIGIIINDSFGRAWRLGTCGVAIGVAGFEPLLDQRGDCDLFGRTLAITVVGLADEIAAAASLVQGQAGQATPVVIVRGVDWQPAAGGIDALLRNPDEDMFR